MQNAKDTILESLNKVISEITGGDTVEATLDIPDDLKNGDYSSSIALKLAKKLGKSPREVAEALKEKLAKEIFLERVEIAGPGFLNFYLQEDYLLQNLTAIIQSEESYGNSQTLSGVRVMTEFAHPNTHKEFHIGHVRNITTGEAISRIFSSQSAQVSRVNYQGDVGMHVAKALFGVRKKLEEERKTVEQVGGESLALKAKFLGEAYALGSKFYEEDEEAKKEIGTINKQIYAKDPEILPLWETTREWSLAYFESIYQRVGTHFDRFFFESQVYESGREIVLSHIDDGIFVKDEGAVIFPGEKFGLHNRVFVTSEGNPTYEGKEMGLAPLQHKEFKFDRALHVVGPEQAGYFKVVFKAIEEVFPELEGKEQHVVYGFVQLKEGKMSSRMGNIVRGEWLIDEAKKRILSTYQDISDETAEKIAVGAVKYSMLKVNREANIAFNFEDSINLHGNSGPYLQYAYARTQNILKKVESKGATFSTSNLEEEEKELLRKLVQFPYVVTRAQTEIAPNYICTYLFDLTQTFSAFYEKHRVIGEDKNLQSFRLTLTAGVGQVIKNGLYLLGIEAPQSI